MSRGKKSRSASRRSSARHPVLASKPLEPGQQAQAPGLTLRSYQVGALPLVNQILERIRLEQFFSEYLPADDPRCQFPTAQALLVLVRNVLVCGSRSMRWARGPRSLPRTCSISGTNSWRCFTTIAWDVA